MNISKAIKARYVKSFKTKVIKFRRLGIRLKLFFSDNKGCTYLKVKPSINNDISINYSVNPNVFSTLYDSGYFVNLEKAGLDLNNKLGN